MTGTGHAARFVYVGTYTEPDGNAAGIGVYRFDAATGALTHRHTVPNASPSYLAVDAGARFLYAVNEIGAAERTIEGRVSAFARDAATGALTFLNDQPSHGTLPCHLTVDPSGRFVIVANYGSGTVAVYPIGPDGALGAATERLQLEGSGPHPRQAGSRAHAATFDPAGRFLAIADLGADRVVMYRLDAAGRLTPTGEYAETPPGGGPRHIVFAPDGRHAYVNNEIGSAVTAYAYDAARGAFTALQTLSTLPPGWRGENTTAEIALHPNGRALYVSNRGHESIAIFAVDAATGQLTAAGHAPTQGSTPRCFALDPGGAYLYAANQRTDTLVAFRVEGTALVPTGEVTPAPTPVCVLFV